MPKFLEDFTREILNTGQYINAYRSCGAEVPAEGVIRGGLVLQYDPYGE